MSPTRLVRAFVSDTPEYHRSFQTFLDHTDQKEKAFAWLSREVDGLPRRDRMIDAGAGTGILTARLAARFRELTAIEPNPSLVSALGKNCPAAQILSTPILGSDAPESDFVLCSHVLYYIREDEWAATVARMAGWVRAGGVLAVALQNPNTDCMKMVKHFIGRRLDLGTLARSQVLADRSRFTVRVDTVEASIEAASLTVASAVAEFMLNVLPMPSPPAWEDLERYVERHFRRPGGGYRFSCDQDFLRVARIA